MKRLVFEVMEDKKEEKKEVNPPKCWICMDQGLVIYNMKRHGMEYEVGARCRCAEGFKMGEAIGIIPEVLIEGIVDINFNNFKNRYPNKIKEVV